VNFQNAIMQFSPEIGKLATALATAKLNFDTPKKSGHNPHYSSAFSTYNDIKEATESHLLAVGLTISHLPISDGEQIGITTILLHSSGEFMMSTLAMKPNKNSEQDVGKIITYFKRYARGAVCGLEGEIDTDGDLVTKSTIYTGSEEQKDVLKVMFKKHGIDKVEDMKKLSNSFAERRRTFGEIEDELQKRG
jgi:hypothetical protein